LVGRFIYPCLISIMIAAWLPCILGAVKPHCIVPPRLLAIPFLLDHIPCWFFLEYISITYPLLWLRIVEMSIPPATWNHPRFSRGSSNRLSDSNLVRVRAAETWSKQWTLGPGTRQNERPELLAFNIVLHIWLHIYIWLYIYMTNIYIYIYIHIYIYMYLYVCIYVYIHICTLYIHMYTCIYVFVIFSPFFRPIEATKQQRISVKWSDIQFWWILFQGKQFWPRPGWQFNRRTTKTWSFEMLITFTWKKSWCSLRRPCHRLSADEQKTLDLHEA